MSKIRRLKKPTKSVISLTPRPVPDNTLNDKPALITDSSGNSWVGVITYAEKGNNRLKATPAMFCDGAVLTDFSSYVEIDRSNVTLLRDVPIVRRKIAQWDASSPATRTKRLTVPDEHGNAIDYRDVTIVGYLSTFENYTVKDRDGDYVRKTAFDKTLKSFMSNPVMLIDHDQKVSSVAGSFQKVQPDASGLSVVGLVSNAPGLKDIRFLVAENHLKTLSMGGLFMYGADGKAIDEVELWEGSIVAIPANPDAKFSVRSLDTICSGKSLKRTLISTKGELRGR